MKQLQQYWEKYRYVLGGAVILLGAGAAILMNQPSSVASADLLPLASDSPVPVAEIVVDVSGAVVNPGIRRLPAGSLVEDALAAAGGFTAQADLAKVAKELNRADALKPNQKVYVPPVGAPAIAAASGTDSSEASSEEPESGGKINLNSADATELDKLPGVGPSIAKRIIEYRTANGPFSSTEQLKEVPGIGDATYEKLADLITV